MHCLKVLCCSVMLAVPTVWISLQATIYILCFHHSFCFTSVQFCRHWGFLMCLCYKFSLPFATVFGFLFPCYNISERVVRSLSKQCTENASGISLHVVSLDRIPAVVRYVVHLVYWTEQLTVVWFWQTCTVTMLPFDDQCYQPWCTGVECSSDCMS